MEISGLLRSFPPPRVWVGVGLFGGAVVTGARVCTMHGSEGNSGINFSSLMVPQRSQLLILLGKPFFVFEISND